MGGAASKSRPASKSRGRQVVKDEAQLKWQPTEVQLEHGQWWGLMCNDAPGEYGSLRRRSEERYTGFFQDEKAHLLGRLVTQKGSRYVGEFQQDQRQGVGTQFQINGNFVRANWSKNLLDGYGVSYQLSEDGNTYETIEGLWSNDKIECAIIGELDKDVSDNFLEIRRKRFVFFDEEGNEIEEPYSAKSRRHHETRIEVQRIGTKAIHLLKIFTNFHENLMVSMEQVAMEGDGGERLQTVWAEAKSALLDELAETDDKVEAIIRASNDSLLRHASLASIGEQAQERERSDKAAHDKIGNAISRAKEYEREAHERMKEVKALQAQKNAASKSLHLLETKLRSLNENLNASIEEKTSAWQNHSKAQEDMQLSEIAMNEMRQNLEKVQENIRKDTEDLKKLNQDYDFFKEQLHSQAFHGKQDENDTDFHQMFNSTLTAIQERKESLASKIKAGKSHLPQIKMQSFKKDTDFQDKEQTFLMLEKTLQKVNEKYDDCNRQINETETMIRDTADIMKDLDIKIEEANAESTRLSEESRRSLETVKKLLNISVVSEQSGDIAEYEAQLEELHNSHLMLKNEIEETQDAASLDDLIDISGKDFLANAEKHDMWFLDYSDFDQLQPDVFIYQKHERKALYKGQLKDGKRHGIGKLIQFQASVDIDLKANHFIGSALKSQQTAFYDGEWLEGAPHQRGVMEILSFGRYEGEWKNGKRHGEGKFEDKYGNEYDGQWQRGLRSGQGRESRISGEVYHGEWKAGMKEGHGKLVRGSLYEYEGRWKRGKMHGIGTLRDRPLSYTGEFRNGEIAGKGHMVLSELEEYKGEFAAGLRHGNGIMIFEDDRRYNGEWLRGEMEGYGVMSYRNGDEYNGPFVHGMRHGPRGSYEFKELDGAPATYIGPFERDKMRGVAKITWKDGRSYEGNNEGGVKAGRGVMLYRDGSRYDGDWMNGKRSGIGKFEYANGNVYEGLFENDECDGWGKCEFKDGAMYMGEWKGNEMNGEGTLQDKDGGKFKGVFVNGRLEGDGEYSHPNGHTYRGEWVANEKSGEGMEVFADGSSYHGQYEHGKAHGLGMALRQDGRKYTGRWKEGLRHGEGTEVEADGVAQYSGEWASDQSKLGKGKMVYSDGSSYDGAWREQRYHGFGIFQSADGYKYAGEWVEGLQDGIGREEQWRQDGTLTSSFQGEFKQGKRRGRGSEVQPDGIVQVGESWRSTFDIRASILVQEFSMTTRSFSPSSAAHIKAPQVLLLLHMLMETSSMERRSDPHEAAKPSSEPEHGQRWELLDVRGSSRAVKLFVDDAVSERDLPML